jgi:transcription factor MYB, plant
MGTDSVTHRPRTDVNLLAGLPNLLAAANLAGNTTTTTWDINALKFQADAAKFQLLQGLVRAIATASSPSVEVMALLAASTGGLTQTVGVDHQGSSCRALQYNRPALTALSLGMTSFAGLLNGFGGSAHAGDGLSSTDLGHSGASGSSMMAAMAPPLVVVEECTNASGGSSSGATPCEETPASSPFERLENLNWMTSATTAGKTC